MRKCKKHRRYSDFGCPLCVQTIKSLVEKLVK